MSRCGDGRRGSQDLTASVTFGTDRSPLRGTGCRNTRNRYHTVPQGRLYALSVEEIPANGTAQTLTMTRLGTGRGKRGYLHGRVRTGAYALPLALFHAGGGTHNAPRAKAVNVRLRHGLFRDTGNIFGTSRRHQHKQQ